MAGGPERTREGAAATGRRRLRSRRKEKGKLRKPKRPTFFMEIEKKNEEFDGCSNIVLFYGFNSIL